MDYVDRIIEDINIKYKDEKEFIQASSEVLKSLRKVISSDPIYEQNQILERLIVPDRIITFKVVHEDDEGKLQVNTGYRVQFNNAVGPYKGGLRFHKSVNQSIIKFLGFEQIFKNSLTGLSLGGAKGGSDFDPHGKSDNEIRRFCQSFMSELYHYIGENMDVPAGDIGVGAKEIGYLYGYYKKLTKSFDAGVLTGKGIEYGGSLIRKEATGYGIVYFGERMMNTNKDTLVGKRVLVSGAGNVAIYALEKAKQIGANVISVSDSEGYIIDEEGIDVSIVKQIKEVNKGRIKEYINFRPNAKYYEGNVFNHDIKFDVAIPCATQNEINLETAKNMVKNGCYVVVEGANMPSDNEALEYFMSINNFLFAPSKAANAGGVATSGLEMAQNSLRLSWTAIEVDKKLREIMFNIHDKCVETATLYGEKPTNYVFGANATGFIKVAKAMIAQGI
jgi:glutamate dehydrogenase (NADP+)